MRSRGAATGTSAPPADLPLEEPVVVSRPGIVFEATPNPIRACRDELGATTLSWSGLGSREIEVHVNAPDGALLTHQVGDGKATTGKWVRNGMTFYLQDVSRGLPRTRANTLATLTVRTTPTGCPA